MLFVLELFAWLWGFGINLPLFIVCTIGLIVLMVYTTYDILTVKDDRDYLTIDVKNLKAKLREANYTIKNLQTENVQLNSMWREAIRNSQEGNRGGYQDQESYGVFNGEGI
jgi:hypothetical protein